MTIPKNKVVRPYAPDYVDAATLAYRICVSASVVEKWKREGKLPPQHDIFGIRRWKWSEVESKIEVTEAVEGDAFIERLNA